MQIHISQILYDQISWRLPGGHGGLHGIVGGGLPKEPEIGMHKDIIYFLRASCTAVSSVC